MLAHYGCNRRRALRGVTFVICTVLFVLWRDLEFDGHVEDERARV